MKTLLSILVVLALGASTDINPLLLWEPYRIFINHIIESSPSIFLCVFLLVLFIGVWIAASDEKQSIAP